MRAPRSGTTKNEAARRKRKLVALLVAPSLAIILSCLLAVYVVLEVSSTRLAQETRVGEERLLAAILENLRKGLNDKVRDYAFWDELDERTKGAIDPTWATDNLGPYAAGAFSVSHLFIIDGADKLAYEYTAADDRDLITWSKLVHPLRLIAADARRAFTPGKAVAIDQIVFFLGEPHLVSASVIQPASAEASRASVDGRVLIFVQNLDAAALARLAAQYRFPELRLRERPHEGDAMLELPARTATGKVVFSWRSQPTGRTLMALAIPGVVVVFVFAAAAFAFLTWIWVRVIASLGAAEAAAQAAHEASAAKSAFIANMSHELRTPLNAIIGFAEVLAGASMGAHANPAYKDFAKDIHMSGRNLLAIINDLLTFAIESGRHAFNIDECLADPLVEEVVAKCEDEAREKGVRLTARMLTERALCLADPKALRSILSQLVGNALKFTPAGGDVTVSLVRENDVARIDVSDTGPGMPEAFLPMLGRPLSQSETAYAREHGGVGLGIALAMAMLDGMRGTLAFDSAPGKGTTARIRLPLSAERADLTAAA